MRQGIGTVTRRLAGVGQAYASVIRGPRYFPLWLGQLVSNFGDTLHYIALVVLVFRLTGEGFAVAIPVAAEVIPVLALGPAPVSWTGGSLLATAGVLGLALLRRFDFSCAGTRTTEIGTA